MAIKIVYQTCFTICCYICIPNVLNIKVQYNYCSPKSPNQKQKHFNNFKHLQIPWKTMYFPTVSNVSRLLKIFNKWKKKRFSHRFHKKNQSKYKVFKNETNGFIAGSYFMFRMNFCFLSYQQALILRAFLIFQRYKSVFIIPCILF